VYSYLCKLDDITVEIVNKEEVLNDLLVEKEEK
jgi:hypothetical protein